MSQGVSVRGLVIPGLKNLEVGDLLTLDAAMLRGMRLDRLRELMRRCGLSTDGIDSAGAAATRIIERGLIED
jgi:hypothetical protein